jgi:hypothetical protein
MKKWFAHFAISSKHFFWFARFFEQKCEQKCEQTPLEQVFFARCEQKKRANTSEQNH